MKFIKEIKGSIQRDEEPELLRSFKPSERIAEEIGTYFDITEFEDGHKYGEEDYDFGEELVGKLILSYPFKNYLEFEVKYKTLHELIDEIRRAYRFAYEDAETTNKFNVWGHDMGDLWLEEISVYKNGDVSLYVGS